MKTSDPGLGLTKDQKSVCLSICLFVCLFVLPLNNKVKHSEFPTFLFASWACQSSGLILCSLNKIFPALLANSVWMSLDDAAQICQLSLILTYTTDAGALALIPLVSKKIDLLKNDSIFPPCLYENLQKTNAFSTSTFPPRILRIVLHNRHSFVY